MAGLIDRSALRNAQPGAELSGAVLRSISSVALGDNGGSRIVRFILSDGSVDRYGDTIDPKGWDLKTYLQNPIVLFGHDADNVESVIGKMVDISTDARGLIGDVQFLEEGINPTADMTYKMLQVGVLNAVSVGFQPIAWQFTTDKSRPGGIDFTKQELLELSVVPIPANANALAIARKAGIDDAPMREWAKRVLNGADELENDVAKPIKTEDADPAADDLAIENEDVKRAIARRVDKLDWAQRCAVAAILDDILNGKAVSITAKGHDIAIVGKKGRVLSADNEKTLREAHGKMNEAVDLVAGVIGQTDPDDEDGGNPDAETPDDSEEQELLARSLRVRRARALAAKAKLLPKE